MINYVMNDVKMINDKEYFLLLDGNFLRDQWESNNITYNPEIQRGSRKVQNKEGDTKEVAVYSTANVNKITDAMLNDDFFVNQITLNLSSDSVFEYDNAKQTLTINKGTLEISDGHHRIRALCKAKKKDKDFNLYNLVFPVKITNFDIETAQEQFYQFTLGRKISSSRIAYFNNKDISNRIAKALYKDSILTNKIETVKNVVSKKEVDKVVSYATLKNAIDYNFSPEKYVSDTEEYNTINFLGEFFNELFKIVPEFNSFEKRCSLRQNNSLKCENFTFYGYLSVAAYLLDKENWKDMLPKLSNIDFSKSSNIWNKNIIKENISKDNSKSTFSIINNTQSRKEMSKILLVEFKKQFL